MNQIINDLKEGYWEEMPSQYSLASKGYYKNNRRIGEWKVYRPNGSLMLLKIHRIDEEDYFGYGAYYNNKSEIYSQIINL